VTGVDEHGVDIVRADGSPGRIEARTKVWAAGVQASPIGARLAEQSGATVDRLGRVAVLEDCTLPGHPEVFVIGDLMSLGGLPGVAEVAMQSGRHAALTVVRRLRGDATRREFRYHDLGTMATVSRFRAVASFGRVRVGGAVAWLLWLFVHLAFLTGFKNRVATLARWAIAFLGRGRPERTITEQQVFARTRRLEADSV
jgi:NADH dehydrogenase